MAELKTKPTKVSVQDFIKKVPEERRREDSEAVLKLMKEITCAEPEM